MALNQTQGVVLAIFGANAGGHLTGLDAIAEANGLSSLAADLSASAGFILGVDLSSDAVFTSTILENLGVEEGTAGYTLAESFFSTNLTAGTSRGALVASAVEYLLGDNIDSSLTTVASTFTSSVEAGVEYSQGEGAAVFGVAQLQAAAGNNSTAGEGSTFTLTSEDDTLTGTAGNDTFTGTTANLSIDDRVLDSTTTDNDVFNLVATADPEAMDVTNVENINIDWQSFGTPDIDLDNVSGATVALSSTKTGYLGNANFDNVGENNISVGAGITGTVTVDGIEDANVTSTVAETIDIGTGTAADGLVTVNAGAAETINITGADNVILTALSATDVTVDTAFDTAALTLGTSGDLALDGASDATVTITSNAAENIDLDIANGMELEQITLAGSGSIDLDFADSSELSGVVVVNGGAIRLADDIGTALDVDEVDHTSITLEATIGADSTITAATGANIVVEENLGNELGIVLTTTNDSGSDEVTVTFEVTQTDTLSTAVATNTDFETVNIIADGDDDITLAQISAGANRVTLASPTNDLTITLIDAEEVDASAMTTDLTLTQNTAADLTVTLGAGDNTLVFTGTTHENTATAGAGDDDVTFVNTTGTAAALLGEGDNTVGIDAITTGEAIVVTGSGDDTINVDALTAGEVSVQVGDGDNVVDFDPGTLAAGYEVAVVMGSGDDEFEFDSANAVQDIAGGVISIDFGTGTDVLDFSAGASTIDLTDGTLTLAGLEVIEFGGQSSNVTLDAATLNGKSYLLKGDGNTADTVELDIDVAGVYDFSNISIDGTIAKAFGGLNIDGAAGNDTITGTDGNDDINTGNGVNTVNAGLGADVITLGTGADTIILGAKSATQTAAFDGTETTNSTFDSVASFDAGSEDKFQLSSAAAAYGSGITLDGDTVINVVTVADVTADDIDGLFAAAHAATAGTSSTSDVLYIYVVENTAGAVDLSTFLIINDGTSTLSDSDTIIELTGLTNTIDSSDFTIV